MEELYEKIVELIEREQRQLDINYVATQLGVHWFTVYKAIADKMLSELQESHRSILFSMPIIPLKTSKSLLLTPKSLLVRVKNRE